ncbi:MAG: DNA alkylation repair protein [Anaerolineales bacterium]|nr:DNA alkylation repair protein [Anaerolineales bacterium]
MPAINISRLRLQAFELAGLLEDHAAFQKSLRALLDENSHRLLRRGRSMAIRSALPAWDVPGILIRELEAALIPAAREKNAGVIAAAAAVWTAGKLEEKQLAAYLAGLSRSSGDVRTLLLQWLEETNDPAVLQDLAVHTCSPLRTSNLLLFRADIRTWIEAREPPRRRFGWMALRAWTDEKTSESVFAAFELLPLVFSETDPETMRLASGLLARLAEFYPQETQGWMSEFTPIQLQQGRKFLRMAVPQLPEEPAAFLRDLLHGD